MSKKPVAVLMIIDPPDSGDSENNSPKSHLNMLCFPLRTSPEARA